VIFEVVVSDLTDNVVLIAVVGEIDLSSAPRLRSELVKVIGVAETPRVIVDLAGVDLLDPIGLGVLLDGVMRSRLRGGSLALARAESQVLRDLELTRVIEILPVFETIADAVESFAK